MERTTPEAYRIAVLTSGLSRGSNLRAIHSYFRSENAPAEIAFTIFTRKEAPVQSLCTELEIPCHYISTREPEQFEASLLELIHAYQPHLIVLAGFLKQLSGEFIRASGTPILNIHPALLPLYGGKGMYGMHVHRAVFEAGEMFSGATVHLVDPLYDHGDIIAQSKVDISACETPEEIAQTVLKAEHALYAPSILSFLKTAYSL